MGSESEKFEKSMKGIEAHLDKLYSLSVEQTGAMINLIKAVQDLPHKSDGTRDSIKAALTNIDELIKLYESVSTDGKNITIDLGDHNE